MSNEQTSGGSGGHGTPGGIVTLPSVMAHFWFVIGGIQAAAYVYQDGQIETARYILSCEAKYNWGELAEQFAGVVAAIDGDEFLERIEALEANMRRVKNTMFSEVD